MALKEAAPRHRVLIVDDEESTRLLLARILTKDLNVEVQLAGTCEQALRLVETQRFDVILLDLLMPGVGGFSVLSEIRRSTTNGATPVIVVSQLTEKWAIDRCLASGASAYHAKPVRRPELIKTIKDRLAVRARQ